MAGRPDQPPDEESHFQSGDHSLHHAVLVAVPGLDHPFQESEDRRIHGAVRVLHGHSAAELVFLRHVSHHHHLALHYFPFGFLLIVGALRNIDSQLEESAELLGASRQQAPRKIVFPLVAPVVFSTFLLTFSRGLGTFGAPAFLGGPVRFYVLSTLLQANLVGQRPGIGYIAAVAMILFGMLVLYMDHKLIGARKSFVTISGPASSEIRPSSRLC